MGGNIAPGRQFIRHKRTSSEEPRAHDQNECMTLEEIAVQLGTSKQRVHQLEKTALAKVRTALVARGIGLDDLVGDDPALAWARKRTRLSE